MPEYDVTITLKPPEKTFRVEAKNKEKAKEEGTDAFARWLLDSQVDLDDLMTIEIHHAEA